MARVRAYIGLGSNVGDSERTLATAIGALGSLRGVRVRAVSRLYSTRPVGVEDQPDFRNAAVALDVTTRAVGDPEGAALDLLVELKRIERELGRQPRERWGPREVDLDLLVFGRHSLALERPPAGRSLDAAVDAGKAARLLEVPHRDAHCRLFVLAPLADIAPGLVPPGWGESVGSACRRRSEAEGVDAVRPVARWDGQGWVREEAAGSSED